MKKRPDWAGDVRRRDALEAYKSRQGDRSRERRQKLKDMTAEEMEALTAEVIAAHETLETLVAEMGTPEALAEATRLREERQQVIGDLRGALLEAGEAVARRFPGIEATVPGYDAEDDEFWLCFDGKHLLWFEARHGMKDWEPVRTCPLRIAIGVPDVLPTLSSALVGRRWHPPQPRNKFTDRSVVELEKDT